MDELVVLFNQFTGLAFRLDQAYLAQQLLARLQAIFASWPMASITSSMCSRTLALSQLQWRSISKAPLSSSSKVTGSKIRRSLPSWS